MLQTRKQAEEKEVETRKLEKDGSRCIKHEIQRSEEKEKPNWRVAAGKNFRFANKKTLAPDQLQSHGLAEAKLAEHKFLAAHPSAIKHPPQRRSPSKNNS